MRSAGPASRYISRYDEVGTHETGVRCSEPAQHLCEHSERRVRHESERPFRKSERRDVQLHDRAWLSGDPCTQRGGPARMQFDGDDSGAGAKQMVCQRAAAGADIDDEFAPPDAT